jgi:hypothetical protein
MQKDLKDINELVEVANRLSIENDKPYLIFDSVDDLMISELTNSDEEKRDSKINFILDDKSYYVDSYEVLSSTLPSRSIYYDTVTNETCPIKRHKKISDILGSFGFVAYSLHRMSNVYETSYMSEFIKNVVIRVYPNLITNVSVTDSEFNLSNYRFFFNMVDIMKVIQKNSSKEYYRDLKIKNILL